MTPVVLLEQPFRGDMWRLLICEYRGKPRLDFRRYYRKGDDYAATKEGAVFPLEALDALREAIDAYRDNAPPDGPDGGS
jgi:hypothetical protein